MTPRPLPRRLAAYAAATLFSLGVLALAFRETARAAPRSARATAAFPALVRRALAMPDTHWVRAESAQVAVYAVAGSDAAMHVERVRAEAEAARAANLALLGRPRYPAQMHLVFVRSREQMRPVVGWTPGGLADVGTHAAAFVSNRATRPAIRHETMHLVSWETWGAPQSQWISEGLATYAAGRCAGRDLHAVAASLADAGDLVPLAELPAKFEVKGAEGAKRYLEAGSVMRYVAETFGSTRLRAFWRTGLDGAPQSLGVDVPTLERGWRARVARARTGEPWAALWTDVERHGCE